MLRGLILSFAALLVTTWAIHPLSAQVPPKGEGDAPAVSDLVKALKSKNADVRKQVALALGDFGTKAKAAVPALREALLDADEAVQAAAARALGQIDPDSKATPKPLEEAERARVFKLQEELAVRSANFIRLHEALKEREGKVAELTAKGEQLKAQAVQSQVEVEVLRKRAAVLEERVRELEIAARQKDGDKEPPANKANPAPSGVKGEIKKTDEVTGLVTLNLGADSGLQKGHTLEVFRLKPEGKYLGQVKIIDVQPKESVARIVGKPLAAIEVGDHVAGKLLPGDK